MTPLPYGVLPSASMLHGPARANGTTADAVFDVLRKAICRGLMDEARDVLRSLGFVWTEPTVSDLDLDVARVADALAGPRLALVHEHDEGDDDSCAECVRLSVDDRALMSRTLAAGEALAGCVASANEVDHG